MEYVIKAFISDQLFLIWNSRYGSQTWATVRVQKKYSQSPCQICKRPIGSNAFRPITNGYNRSHRICSTCVDNFVKQNPPRESAEKDENPITE